ncbi:MAG: hypothetical protein H0V01_05040 [Bacteroidetes bacterium]|nr:hypothetical protein [Bacteroidota bacterium]HET6245751.1 hypothetical protein [Bacteroidia bacterium]
MDDKINFPVYIKYSDNKSWFKINSVNEFEELKVSGKYYSVITYQAKILPDRNFIYDLTYGEIGVKVTKIQYDKQLKYCLENLAKIDF